MVTTLAIYLCEQSTSWLINAKPWIDIIFPAFVVVLGIATICYNIRHSKKSVVPLIYMDLDMMPTGEHKQFYPVILNLMNVGLGPALLDKIIYRYKNKDYDCLFRIFEDYEIINYNLLIRNKTNNWIYPECYLASNKEKILFQMYFSAEDEEEVKPIIQNFLKEVEIIFSYKGVYKDKKIPVREFILNEDFRDLNINYYELP